MPSSRSQSHQTIHSVGEVLQMLAPELRVCLTSKEQAVEQALWLQLLRDSKSKSTGLSSCKLEYEDLLLNMLSAVSDPITPTHLACCGVSVQSYRS